MIRKIYRWLSSLRVWRHGIVTPQGYFQLTWMFYYLITIALIASANAATSVAFIGSAVLVLFSIFRPRSANISRFGLYSQSFFYFLSFLILIWAFTGNRQSKDIAVVAMEVLLAATPALLGKMTSQRRVFAAITATNLIGIGAILLADNINAYNLFVVFIGFMALTMNATRIYFISLNAQDSSEKLTVNYFTQLIRVLPYGLAMGAVIFYAFPRMSDLAVDLNLSGFNSRTGYTSQIKLDKVGSIEEDDKINLWIQAKDIEWLANEASTLYLRGSSLDRFDGTEWTRSTGLSNLAMNTKDFRVNKAHNRDRKSLVFYREAVLSRDILVPYGLWQLEFNRRLNQDIFVDGQGNIQITRDQIQRYQYEVTHSPSISNGIDGLSLILSEYRNELKNLEKHSDRFYKLPADDQDEVTRTPQFIVDQPWFADFTKKVNSTLTEDINQTSVGTILRNLQRYFRQNYQPTLRAEFTSDNPLRDFLTTQKQGHCELFSTAAALYLRSLGIPTRVVSGYRGGQFNYVSNMLEVPEKFAHAWLEVYHQEFGWLVFDPTPLLVPTGPQSTLESSLKTIINAVTFWFTRYVVDYDFQAQRELRVTISRIDLSKLSDFNHLSWDQNTAELGLLAVLFVVAVWLLIRVILRRDNLPDTPDYYRKLALRLLKSGLPKNPGESYLEYHKRLAHNGVNHELLEIAHAALERDIYTDKPLQASERRAVKKALVRLPLMAKRITAAHNDQSQQRAHG